ncbi:MAG: glycerol kinase GlpK [Gammaproteobacteria bacterium]
MMKYILVIDQGTSSTREIIFDNEGVIVSQSQRDITQYFPQNGWVEHDVEEIWQKVRMTCQRALQKANLKASDICACGLSNQRETTVLWHKETGEALHRAIVWQDRRTSEYCEQLKTAGHSDLIRDKTGLLLDPYFSASKIHWLFKNVPAVQPLADKGLLAFGTIDSFLLWRLTNDKNHVTDITNASRTLLFNIHSQIWDEELLALFSLPRQILPQVLDCNANFGHIDKKYFGAAIPILGVAGDQQAALIGQGCFKAGMLKATYGTGGFLLLNSGKSVVASDNGLLSTIAYRIDGDTAYGVEGGIFNAGTTIKWLRDELGLLDNAAQSEQVASSVVDHGGVYFVPAFTGLGAPYWDANARGAIMGLTRNSERGHIVQAALAAVAYQTRDIIDCMQKDGQQSISALRVDGGMSANRWLLQFLADILRVPIQTLYATEMTALGVMFLAGLGVGMYENLNDINALWDRANEYLPRMDITHSEALYAGWQNSIVRIKS